MEASLLSSPVSVPSAASFPSVLSEIVLSATLSSKTLPSAVELLISDLQKRLADKQLKLVVTDAAKNAIIDGGDDLVVMVIASNDCSSDLTSAVKDVLGK